jgi:hypothetical protein
MTNRGRDKKPKEATIATHEGKQPSSGWGAIFRGAFAELLSHSWLQNLLIGAALLLIWPLIGATVMKSHRATIIGFGIGITVLVWIVVFILLKQTNEPLVEPLSVFPNSLDLSNAGRGTTVGYDITIVNSTPHDLYQVLLQVKIDSPSITQHNLMVRRVQPDEDASHFSSFSSLTDPATNTYHQVIRRIGPGQSAFKLDCRYEGVLPSNVKHRIDLSIVGFSTEPVPVINIPVSHPNHPSLDLKEVRIDEPIGSHSPSLHLSLINNGTVAYKAEVHAAFSITTSPLQRFLLPQNAHLSRQDEVRTGAFFEFNAPISESVFKKIKNGELQVYAMTRFKCIERDGNPLSGELCFHYENKSWTPCHFDEVSN